MSQPVSYESLRSLLTTERLGSYTAAAQGDLRGAFELYEWNIEVAAAAMSLTAMVEVVLRNALDREMRAWAKRRGVDDWMAAAPLDDHGRTDIAKARRRAAHGHDPTHGHVVAELNFGFWRFLMAKRYLTALWVPAMHNAFPHAPGDARQKQTALEAHAQQLLFLRNRAAHHEPLHRRNLASDLTRALDLVGSIHPAARDWVASTQRLSALLRERPSYSGDVAP